MTEALPTDRLIRVAAERLLRAAPILEPAHHDWEAFSARFPYDETEDQTTAIAEVAVFPVASDLAEDEVMAAIILHDGARVTHEEIIRHCEGKMSYFAVPRYLEFTDDLPKTANGKIQKFRLRERGIASDTWDREAAGVTVRR